MLYTMEAMNFLDFNGKRIMYLSADGETWVAIKPICEAIGVHYKHQHAMVKSDKILGPASCIHGMQVPGDQLRNMLCLPEMYVYGWLFGIRSESPALLEYKKECYEVLYNHFHGLLSKRRRELVDKSMDLERMQQLEESLKKHDEFQEYMDVKGRILRRGKALARLDKDLEQGQVRLMFGGE